MQFSLQSIEASQRTSRVTKNGALTLEETRSYDKFGRLVEITSDGKSVKYSYDAKNRLSMQTADNMPIEFSYTKYGQLENKTLGGKLKPVSSLTYIYTKSGQIAGRVVDGKHQMYDYDKKGQLLSVADRHGNIAESYVYDPAGNILSKTVEGKTTTFTYDKANQLICSTCDGITTNYKYDAAGRLIKEGDKTYTYGWLDKILSVQEKGTQTAAFDYHMDGQIASATQNGKTESFLWDGLALIHRGETGFINEPYVTGGNPLLSSKGEIMFNDILGSTLGVNNETGFNPVKMTAFGETENKEAFFTGKPAIGELGYAFLFRNYRADQGKWQTSDPMGYPDGWNNLAYCSNGVNSRIDPLGLDWIDDIIASCARSAIQDFINRAIQAGQNGVTADTDIYVKASGLDLSTIQISYTYSDAVSLFFIPLGSGSGTISGNSIQLPSDVSLSYENVFVRLENNKYTVLDDESEPTNLNGESPISVTYNVNQRYGEWYDFSAVTINTVTISGFFKADILKVIPRKYKEE